MGITVVTLPNRKPFSTPILPNAYCYDKVVTLPNRKPFSTPKAITEKELFKICRNPSESEAIFNIKKEAKKRAKKS